MNKNLTGAAALLAMLCAAAPPAAAQEPKFRLEDRDERSPIRTLAFSPDGKRLAAGREDYAVSLWDPVAGTLLRKVASMHDERCRSLAFDPSDGRLLCSRENGIWKLDPEIGERKPGFPVVGGRPGAFGLSPNGKTLACVTAESLGLYDLASGAATKSFVVAAGPWRALAFDGKSIFGCNNSPILVVWDAGSGERRSWGPAGGAIKTLACSPDGKRIATGGENGEILVWDIVSGKPVVKLQVPSEKPDSPAVLALAWTPDGSVLASGATDRLIRLWTVSTGESVALAGHTRWVNVLTFSPDGHQLCSGGEDGLILLWNIPTPKK